MCVCGWGGGDGGGLTIATALQPPLALHDIFQAVAEAAGPRATEASEHTGEAVRKEGQVVDARPTDCGRVWRWCKGRGGEGVAMGGGSNTYFYWC